MQIYNDNHQLLNYTLAADETGNQHFRVYNYIGTFPNRSDVLIPHRKDYYLIVLVRRAGCRQWIDMKPYILKDNTVYFTGPGQIIVKEEFVQLWSTGIAFTKEFLSFQENVSLNMLPIIRNPQNEHKLTLTETDVNFVEEIIARINTEYQNPSEWQQRMFGAYLTTLITYLSRLYTEQFKETEPTVNKLLLRSFLAKINEKFRELHEVSDYAPLLNISAGHLSELVKNQSGKPAIKHIHERLVMESHRLLCHTNKSLKEIAFDLGFSEASYFSRFFKRETGSTPVEYRTGIREMSY